ARQPRDEHARHVRPRRPDAAAAVADALELLPLDDERAADGHPAPPVKEEFAEMFKQALTEIVERTEGATGALIMGMDGVAVERVFLPEGSDANMDVAAAEVTSLVRSAVRAGSNTGLGPLGELFLSYGQARILARLFSPE